MATVLGKPNIFTRKTSWREVAVGAATVAAPFVYERNPTEIERNADPVGLFQTVKPFIATAAVIITGSMLIAAIYFTVLDLQWIAFLTGILFASIITMSTQAARAELSAANRNESLGLARYALAGETTRREAAEKLLEVAQARLHYSDFLLPVMLAFVDHDTRYVYHNRAFRDWIGLPDEKIDGKHMREVLGRSVFAEIEPYVFEAAGGHIARYERTQLASDGSRNALAVQFLPQAAEDGQAAGFHVVMTNVAEQRDFAAEVPAEPAQQDELAGLRTSAWQDASKRILAAINGNEFVLFCQRIEPLAGAATGTSHPGPAHHEVLIRLLEEESGLVPPGAFFSLAEEHGLLPQLDRWVFAHVLDWMASPSGATTVTAGEIYFINVSAATLSDPAFPDFVDFQLRRTGVPASAVCIEIAESDMVLYQGDAVAFARKVRLCGCRIAISGFGQNRRSTAILRLLPADFLKIDSGIVRRIGAYPVQLGKIISICKIAKALELRTIAEMVEDPETLAALNDAQVDFAQGFGIALPKPLSEVCVEGAALQVA